MYKSILSLLFIFTIFCLNVESFSMVSPSLKISSPSQPQYLYSILTDQAYRSNQTIAKIDALTGEIVNNSTFHSMKVIYSLISVNETANTMLIYAGAPANKGTLQLLELDMTSLTFSVVGKNVEYENIVFQSFGQPYIYVNGTVYYFGHDASDSDYYFSVQSWDFNTGKWDIFSIQVDNFSPLEYPIGAYDLVSGNMYAVYQAAGEQQLLSVAIFDPLKLGAVSNEYNNITGLSLAISLIFTDNKGQLYAIQRNGFQGIEICKFNFDTISCDNQTAMTLGFGYQLNRYSPFLLSADSSKLIILSPSSESTPTKPILDIITYDIATWTVLQITSTPNVWTGGDNNFNLQTYFISN